jgi:hypothetical protein
VKRLIFAAPTAFLLSEMPLDFWPGRPRQRRRVAAESPFQNNYLPAILLDVRAEVVAINRGRTLHEPYNNVCNSKYSRPITP